jgi:hypothetical protein
VLADLCWVVFVLSQPVFRIGRQVFFQQALLRKDSGIHGRCCINPDPPLVTITPSAGWSKDCWG